MIFFENEYAVIEHQQEEQILAITWKKYTPSANYREIVAKFYEAKLELNITRVMADSRRLPIVGTDDAAWTVEMAKRHHEIIPVTHSAIIISEATFIRLSVEMMVNEFRLTHHSDTDKIVYRYFNEPDQAMTWLMEVEQQASDS